MTAKSSEAIRMLNVVSFLTFSSVLKVGAGFCPQKCVWQGWGFAPCPDKRDAGPIYVPPSADPNYEPVDVKA